MGKIHYDKHDDGNDDGIIDSQPGYDVYGFRTLPEIMPDPHHIEPQTDGDNYDDFPCRCGAIDCPNYGTLRNPYL